MEQESGMAKYYVLKHETTKFCVVSKETSWPDNPGYKKHKEFDTEAKATKWIDDNCDVTC